MPKDYDECQENDKGPGNSFICTVFALDDVCTTSLLFPLTRCHIICVSSPSSILLVLQFQSFLLPPLTEKI